MAGQTALRGFREPHGHEARVGCGNAGLGAFRDRDRDQAGSAAEGELASDRDSSGHPLFPPHQEGVPKHSFVGVSGAFGQRRQEVNSRDFFEAGNAPIHGELLISC